jgi:hypothetical protein
MPAYPGSGLAQLLPANRQVYMWETETVPVDTYPVSLSVAYQLERVPNVIYPWGLSFELTFSGNPGNFEVDILAANSDTPTSFVKIGSITQASQVGVSTGSYTYRYDMASNIWPKFIAAYLKTLANPVSVTLQATK